MAKAEAQIHSSEESMGPFALSLGDVLASARSRYGNPWLPALQIPRRSSGLYLFLTPDEFGLTYSFHAFTTGGHGNEGGYLGEPTVSSGNITRRGVTEGYWRAFAQDYRSALPRVFGGEFSALEGVV